MPAALRYAGWSLLLLLAACGGGGGGGYTGEEARLAAICAEPRTGFDPYNDNQPYPDRPGTLADERRWVLAHMRSAYLWPDEIPSVNASAYSVANYGSVMVALANYFYALLTPAMTPSGKYKDEFSFVYPTDLWNASSVDGETVSYGLLFSVQYELPREARIAYTEASAPTADLDRGLRVVAIDGLDFAYGPESVADALYPQSAGEQHTFTFARADDSTFTRVLTAQVIVETPVPQVQVLSTDGGKLGYLLFNSHIATSEGQLVDAVTTLRNADVDDLVLDLRYNGGGYLDIAAELAYMIAGSGPTTGKVFERLHFHPRNPRNSDDTVTPFYTQSQGIDPLLPAGTPLPTLNLSRVYVLTTDDTCSASEALINGLRGVDVQVIQIGGTSCGKPYGFYPTDNCGLTYFAIEFSGTNAKNFGDYADGFVPNCAASDDFTHALGDVNETLLATAIAYRDTGHCVAVPRAASRHAPQLLRSPLREIAWPRRAP